VHRFNGKRYFWYRLKSKHDQWKKANILSLPLYGRKTNRLVASSKTNQFLKTKYYSPKGEEVDLIVSHITELGISNYLEQYKAFV
jgi:predicted RNA-binding protein (virulence factor B family)